MDSVKSIFKIGIGPSSSHTLGPMRATNLFLQYLEKNVSVNDVEKITVDLYGSLSLTGKGHMTDGAILLGLAGYQPESVPTDLITQFIATVKESNLLSLGLTENRIPFCYDADLILHKEYLPLHENGMKITACTKDHKVFSQTYYSVGGGEVETEESFGKKAESYVVPYPFASAEELLALCDEHSLSIGELTYQNECSITSASDIREYCNKIWSIMSECMEAGLEATGILPGPLKVPRRANALRNRIIAQQNLRNDPFSIMDRVNMFALAVSEQNASGCRVVTAPTNGSCGIIPAVLQYYNECVAPLDEKMLLRFILTSGAIGLLYRMNASLSGAEVGCQGEVGVACSMAAAGLAELMGASASHVCMAAEIGMEHNLGLTCDPIIGQVQIPCIERNAINAVKAINSARIAMERVTVPRVSLDNVIEAMMATGKDMNSKYRETAQGGLAALRRFNHFFSH